MKSLLTVLTMIVMTTMLRADEPAWKPVTTELLKQERTGFGGLCGVVVDHVTGDLWVNLSDRGMFHSTDQGQTWKRVSDAQPNGRTETPGCWLLDPTGQTNRMVAALVYGAPISVSNDRAATWKSLDGKSSHIDWCAVDWTDPEMRFMLALKHEAGGLLLASRDGGKSFEEVGTGYATGWIFNQTTAVVAEARSAEKPQPRLMRTADSGRTFESCGDFSPVGNQSAQALPKLHGDTLYWLVDGGLIATTDNGMTWQKRGEVKGGQSGPIFGDNAQHMFVLTKAGPVESRDGGVTWSAPLAPPSEMKGVGGLSWLEYDPKHDTLYLMKMGSELYQLRR